MSANQGMYFTEATQSQGKKHLKGLQGTISDSQFVFPTAREENISPGYWIEYSD